MKIGRLIAGTTVAVTTGIAAYLALTRQDPITWGRQVKHQAQVTAQQLDDIRTAKEHVAANAQKLSQAIDDGTQTLNAIQTQVDKFEFKIAPRLAEIQKTLDHMETSQF